MEVKFDYIKRKKIDHEFNFTNLIFPQPTPFQKRNYLFAKGTTHFVKAKGGQFSIPTEIIS